MDTLDRRFRGNRTYDPRHLWEQHHEILRRLVRGESPGSIAEELDITPQTVSNVRNSPIAQRRLAELRGVRDERMMDIPAKVKEIAPIALELLENIITGRDEEASIGLRARTAEQMLARAGYGPLQKSISMSHTLTANEIELLKERSRQAAMDQGAVVVDYEHVEDRHGPLT